MAKNHALTIGTNLNCGPLASLERGGRNLKIALLTENHLKHVVPTEVKMGGKWLLVSECSH